MLDIFFGFILGLVQGVTEILPISSTAHLILVGRFLGVPQQSLEFDVFMNFASWLAIILFFYRALWDIVIGWLKMLQKGSYALLDDGSKKHVKLGLYLLISMIPAVMVGFLFEEFIENHLRSNLVIGSTLIIGGLLLMIADVSTSGKGKAVDASWWKIFIVGCFQSFALIPGMSRSGSTITGARFMGISREESASFAFLMGTPIIIAATVSQIPELFANETILSWSVLSAFIGAIIGTYATIALFLSFIKNQTYLLFVAYRLILGLLLVILSLYEI